MESGAALKYWRPKVSENVIVIQLFSNRGTQEWPKFGLFANFAKFTVIFHL